MKTCYVCKYTPLELLAAYGGETQNLDQMSGSFENADKISHPNLCGFGRSVIEAVLKGEVKELILVNCCDTIKAVYDILKETGKLDFLYMLDILRSDNCCSIERTALELEKLSKAYGEYKHASFDLSLFKRAFHTEKKTYSPHIAVMGARMGNELFEMTKKTMPLPVTNETCVNNRNVSPEGMPETQDFRSLMLWYAKILLGQLPCMRMTDNTGRRVLYEDPSLKGIIYHTVKFCDFYSFEYAELKSRTDLPLLKIESDYTLQGPGQLKTRLEAFAETLAPEAEKYKNTSGPNKTAEEKNSFEEKNNLPEERIQVMDKAFFAGIDSGSASTDVVILNEKKEIAGSCILPTGAGASSGAQRALEEALKDAGLKKENLRAVVTTGYGRSSIDNKNKAITEISCHAKGAVFLDPSVRTVIDIGGQDSKVIVMDEKGKITNFAMNDKCAAGTGRFLEMMAKTLEMSLEEMSRAGLSWKEDLTISNMCTVFAESEVVSLIAQNKNTSDIIHGLNKAVASKTAALYSRCGGKAPVMMTGGVARNDSLAKTLEEYLNTKLIISDKAQLCGALGAALFAMEI